MSGSATAYRGGLSLPGRNEKETALRISNSLLSSDGNHVFQICILKVCSFDRKLIEENRNIYPLRPASTW